MKVLQPSLLQHMWLPSFTFSSSDPCSTLNLHHPLPWFGMAPNSWHPVGRSHATLDIHTHTYLFHFECSFSLAITQSCSIGANRTNQRCLSRIRDHAEIKTAATFLMKSDAEESQWQARALKGPPTVKWKRFSHV